MFTVTYTKFLATVALLPMMSSKDHVMPPHFFQDLKLNSAGFVKVLETIMKPGIDRICHGKLCVF